MTSAGTSASECLWLHRLCQRLTLTGRRNKPSPYIACNFLSHSNFGILSHCSAYWWLRNLSVFCWDADLSGRPPISFIWVWYFISNSFPASNSTSTESSFSVLSRMPLFNSRPSSTLLASLQAMLWMLPSLQFVRQLEFCQQSVWFYLATSPKFWILIGATALSFLLQATSWLSVEMLSVICVESQVVLHQ